MRISLFVVVLFLEAAGCHARASASNPSASAALQKRTDDLTREHAALKARIAVLEQTMAALQAASKTEPVAPQPLSADDNPAVSPVTVTGGAPDRPATVHAAGSRTSLPAPKPSGGAAGIVVEDLGGQPPTASASASSTQGMGVSDDQTRALLDQLNNLSQEFKSKQAAQQAALEETEGIR